MAARDRSITRRRRRVVPALALLILLVLLVLATAGWLAFRGLKARDAGLEARAAAERTRAAVLDGDDATARAQLAVTQRAAGRTSALVSDPVWRLAAHAPFLGDDVRAIRTVAAAVDDLARDVLPPLVAVGSDVRPGALRLSGSRLDLGPIVAAQPRIDSADDRARAISATLAATSDDSLAGPIRRGLLDARTALAEVVDATGEARTAADLLPPMLGVDGPRRYFLAFQNNAEARGTGGLLGAYGVLEADRGRLRLLRLGPNTDLAPATAMPVDLGADFAGLYGEDAALWANANLSPHFPYAARIWLALWEQQKGQRLDGVIATDPAGLAELLRATGPVRLDNGSQVTAGNAVDLTMRDVYARFPEPRQNTVRDRYLQQIARAVFARVLGGDVDARALVTGLRAAAGQRRLLVYSTRAEEQAQLARTAMAGELDDRAGPYAGLVVNNGAGGKLDYYLERRLAYVSDRCAGGERRSRLTVTLTNTAPPRGLPDYVSLRVDRGNLTEEDEPDPRRQPAGTNVSIVQVYGANGAELLTARLDGEPILVTPGVERGHAVFQFRVRLAAGETRVAELDLAEPEAAVGPIGGFTQPLVKPQANRVDVRPCRPPA